MRLVRWPEKDLVIGSSWTEDWKRISCSSNEGAAIGSFGVEADTMEPGYAALRGKPVPESALSPLV